MRRVRAAPGCLDVAITADTVAPDRASMHGRRELDVEVDDMLVSHVDFEEIDPFG